MSSWASLKSEKFGFFGMVHFLKRSLSTTNVFPSVSLTVNDRSDYCLRALLSLIVLLPLSRSADPYVVITSKANVVSSSFLFLPPCLPAPFDCFNPFLSLESEFDAEDGDDADDDEDE